MFANAAVLTLLEQDSMTGDAFDRERGADASLGGKQQDCWSDTTR